MSTDEHATPLEEIVKIFLVLLLAILIGGCKSHSPEPNQQQGKLSPSGRYIVKVPIEESTKKPGDYDYDVWKVTILDAAGKIQYRDEGSTFLGRFNVYWGWDSADRLWLYNSDDGRIWRWELQENGWQRSEGEGNYSIPEEVLPAYARKAREKSEKSGGGVRDIEGGLAPTYLNPFEGIYPSMPLSQFLGRDKQSTEGLLLGSGKSAEASNRGWVKYGGMELRYDQRNIAVALRIHIDPLIYTNDVASKELWRTWRQKHPGPANALLAEEAAAFAGFTGRRMAQMQNEFWIWPAGILTDLSNRELAGKYNPQEKLLTVWFSGNSPD